MQQFRQSILSNISIVIVATLVGLGFAEILLRSIDRGPLPPLPVVERPSQLSDIMGMVAGTRERVVEDFEIDGQKLTAGDIWGYYRLDQTLGYTIDEAKASVNGWWQSNNIGARSRVDTSPSIPEGKRRLLIFGESFGTATAVRQEDAWSDVLQVNNPRLEVVNLSVAGYSMAQAYLRYLSIKDHIETNIVALMFVPIADLWRDINVIRDLAQPWSMPFVQPRFVTDGNQLKLIASPYANPLEIFKDNRVGLSERLRNHLSRYDRFYIGSLYEAPPIIGDMYMYKLAASVYGNRLKDRVAYYATKLGSEAINVSHQIFMEMEKKANQNGAEFVLIVLPLKKDLVRQRKDSAYADYFNKIVQFSCSNIKHCIDLTPSLQAAPDNDVDLAVDGAHFGPKMNHLIAKSISSELARRGITSDIAITRKTN